MTGHPTTWELFDLRHVTPTLTTHSSSMKMRISEAHLVLIRPR